MVIRIHKGTPEGEQWKDIGAMLADGYVQGIDQPAGINWEIREEKPQKEGVREIQIFAELIHSVWAINQYLRRRGGGSQFTRKEVNHILKGYNVTARFGDMVMFGGLLYKEGKGHWGMNMERCAEFFRGELAIPVTILKDRKTGEIVGHEGYSTVHQIPKLGDLLNSDAEYVTHYRNVTATKPKQMGLNL